MTLAAAACSRNVYLLPARGDASDGVGPNDVGAPDAITNTNCSGLGDWIPLPTGPGTTTCAAALATRGHRFALCSCGDMNAPARVRSDAYDSRDATVFDELAAAIGIGGYLHATAEVRAGGALHVAGAGGVDTTSQFRSTGSLRVGGPFAIRGDNADVEGDAFVNGNVTASDGGRLRVTGTLHVPQTAMLTGDVEYGLIAREAVAVARPCDCDISFVDVGRAITALTAFNDDGAIKLDATALAVVPAPKRIDLPCGRFFLNDINADAAVTIGVHGRTLLAVSGDVTVDAGLTVELDPLAELDLIVGGRLNTSGGGTFGAPAAAARFRVWVAGTTSVTFDGAPVVSAVIHAPFATVAAPLGLTLSGSVLAQSVTIAGEWAIHYDRAILAAGTVCGEPAAAIVP